MNPLASVLVATDFSEEANAALRRAASIAAETGMHGVLAHVLPGSLPPDVHLAATSQAKRALSLLVEEAAPLGLRLEPRLLTGDPAGELLRAASEFDLVVAGARGGELLLDFGLGRTSTRLVRRSERPTLIVKRPPQGPYRRIVAAVDFSAPSLAAAATVSLLAPGADIHLVNAFDAPFESTLRLAGVEEDKVLAHRHAAQEKALAAMDGFATRLAVPSARLWRSVARGYPPKLVLDHAAQAGTDLVAVGKHDAGVLEKLLVGSVALRILEHAECDVLVVPEVPQ